MEYDYLHKQLEKGAKTFTPDQKRDLYLLTSGWAEADFDKRLLQTDPPVISAADAFPIAMKLRRSKGVISGVSTGYKKLDTITLGFDPGELILMYGAQNRGKTMLAQSILHNMGLNNIPSLFISIEMPIVEAMNRFIDMQSSAPGPSDWAQKLSVYFYPDELDYTPDLLKEYIHFMIRSHGIKMVVIDHLSVLPPLNADQRLSYGEWARILQSWTKQLKIPIILIHHTRKMMDENLEPTNADIAETQMLANLSAQIIRVWRDADTDNVTDKRIVKVRVVKNKYKNLGGYTEFYIDDHFKLNENVIMFTSGSVFSLAPKFEEKGG